MSRERFVWREGLGVVNVLDLPPEPPKPRTAYVIGDVQPFRSVGTTGEVIGGRRQMRDHYRAHGVIEVGNEPINPRGFERPKMPPAGPDVKKAIEMVRAGKGAKPIPESQLIPD